MSDQKSSPFRSRQQRDADREAKREAVLHAAVRMFNERGFQSTTFDEVAASLGVSKPTIYHYLGNKENVLLECVNRGIGEIEAAAASAASSPGSALDRLRVFLKRFAENAMEDFGRCVIRTYEHDLSPEGAEKFRSLKRGVDRALRKMVREAMEEGSVAEDDVRFVAFTMADALNGPARWYKLGTAKERKEYAQRMVDLLLKGVIQGA